MSWIIAALGVGTAVAALAGYQRRRRRHAEERRGVWREVALARSGRYQEWQDPSGMWFGSIDVAVDHVRVLLDTHAAHGGRLYTRGRARFPLPRGPVFSVHPEKGLETIRKELGGQDVQLGADPTFDYWFVVKCDEPEAVRRVWSPRATRTMRRSFEKARITSDGAEVELMIPGPLDVAGFVDDAIVLVAEIAGADLFGLAALRALPGATYHPPVGPWNERTSPYAVVEGPVPVTIAPVLAGRRVVTRATVNDSARDRTLKILARPDGTVEPAHEVARLPAPAAGLLRRVGHGTLLVDGATSSFTWFDVESDPERLAAGARLVAALVSGPAQGVYR